MCIRLVNEYYAETIITGMKEILRMSSILFWAFPAGGLYVATPHFGLPIEGAPAYLSEPEFIELMN